jgi:hypothetical protein
VASACANGRHYDLPPPLPPLPCPSPPSALLIYTTTLTAIFS